MTVLSTLGAYGHNDKHLYLQKPVHLCSESSRKQVLKSHEHAIIHASNIRSHLCFSVVFAFGVYCTRVYLYNKGADFPLNFQRTL